MLEKKRLEEGVRKDRMHESVDGRERERIKRESMRWTKRGKTGCWKRWIKKEGIGRMKGERGRCQ